MPSHSPKRKNPHLSFFTSEIFRISFLPCVHVECQFCSLQSLYFLSPPGMPESQGKDTESYSSSSNPGDSVASFGQVSSFCPRGKCMLTLLGICSAGLFLLNWATLRLESCYTPLYFTFFLCNSLGRPQIIRNCSGFFSKGFLIFETLKVGLMLFFIIYNVLSHAYTYSQYRFRKTNCLQLLKNHFEKL